MNYTTLEAVKGRLDIADTTDDTQLSAVITAASRWIDRHTGRRFYAESETRYYSAHDARCVVIDDCQSVTALATDDDLDRTYSQAWTATDYELWPPNAALSGGAYSEIRVTPEGDYTFPTQPRAVKVTGSFGATATSEHPAEISEACILLTMRLWKRKDAIFGVAGAPALGVQVIQARITADADIMALISPYKRAFW